MQSSRYRKRKKLQANTERSQLYGIKDLQTHFKIVKVCFEIRFKLHLFLVWYLTGPWWHWGSFGCYTWSSGKLCYFLETAIIFKNSTWQLLEVNDQRKQITGATISKNWNFNRTWDTEEKKWFQEMWRAPLIQTSK